MMGGEKLKHQLCCHLGIVLLAALGSVKAEDVTEMSSPLTFSSSTAPSGAAATTEHIPDGYLPDCSDTYSCATLSNMSAGVSAVHNQSLGSVVHVTVQNLSELPVTDKTTIPFVESPKIFYPKSEALADDPQNHARAAILNSLAQDSVVPPSSSEARSVPSHLHETTDIPTLPVIVAAQSTIRRVVTQPASHFVLTQNISHLEAGVDKEQETDRPRRDFHVSTTPATSRRVPSTAAKTMRPTTIPSTRHANRDLRQRDQNANVDLQDVEIFNATLPSYLSISLNGTCDDIEHSQDATNGFVTAFERNLARYLHIPEDHVHVWEIRCGSLIVNFSLIWSDQSGSFESLQRKLAEHGFMFVWSGNTYAAMAVKREYVLTGDYGDQALSRLEVGPATGHVYQGFIYIIIGAVLGVIILVIATVFIVRLHRRKGRAFSVSGDSTPTKFSDVNDYTLTRIPRTTKLYLDDVERNPWAYTNPDFHGSLTTVVPGGKKTEYLNFVNTGMIPMRDRSPAASYNGSTVAISPRTKDNLSGEKLTTAMGNPVAKASPSFTHFDRASTKQKMFVEFHNQSLQSGSIAGGGVGGGSSRTDSTSMVSSGPVSTLPTPAPALPRSYTYGSQTDVIGHDSSHI